VTKRTEGRCQIAANDRLGSNSSERNDQSTSCELPVTVINGPGTAGNAATRSRLVVVVDAIMVGKLPPSATTNSIAGGSAVRPV